MASALVTALCCHRFGSTMGGQYRESTSSGTGKVPTRVILLSFQNGTGAGAGFPLSPRSVYLLAGKGASATKGIGSCSPLGLHWCRSWASPCAQEFVREPSMCGHLLRHLLEFLVHTRCWAELVPTTWCRLHRCAHHITCTVLFV